MLKRFNKYAYFCDVIGKTMIIYVPMILCGKDCVTYENYVFELHSAS